MHQQQPAFFESYYICRNVDDFYSNFNVTARYNRRVSHGVLSHAVRNIILDNSTLACNFFQVGEGNDRALNGKNYVKRLVERIEVDDIIKYVELDTPFDSKYARYLNDIKFTMNAESPLWCLVVASYKDTQYLTFVTDHAMVDGNCGVSFHHKLVQQLASLQADIEPVDIVLDYSKDQEALAPLTPTFDALGNLTKVPWWKMLAAILKLYALPRWLTNIITKWTNPDFPDINKNPLFSYKTHKLGDNVNFEILNIAPNDMAAIIGFLRSQKWTLTPFLSTVALQTMQQTVLPCVSNTPYSLSMEIAINGRRFFPSKNLDFNFCVCESTITLPPFTSNAVTIDNLERPINIFQKGLGESSIRDGFHRIGMLSYINAFDFLHGRLKSSDRATMALSNLGNNTIQAKDFECEELWFSQDLGFSGHIGLSTISTPKGGLNITVHYYDYLTELRDPDTKERAVDQFSAKLVQNLMLVVKTTPLHS